MRRRSDAGVLAAYLKMIKDGTAFSNWGEAPDSILRQKLVNSILKDKGILFEDTQKLKRMKHAVRNIKTNDDEALKEAIEEFLIKEDDFKV